MAASSGSLLANTVQLVVPQPCFDEFFVKYNILNVVCLKLVMSKILGYGIILGSVLVKVPQIVKILKAKSGEGINILSTTLEITAITATMAYSYSQGFPFSAYGEAFFLLIQTLMTAFLVMYYTNRKTFSAFYMSVYVLILSYLLSPVVPNTVLWYLQASVLPNIVIARVIQAVTNFRNQSSGQLSLVTYFLLFAGSVARIFTSVQETGDITVIAIYITSSLCNFVLLSQILYYGGAKVKKQ